MYTCIYYALYIYNPSAHSSADGYLGGFQFFAMVNKAANAWEIYLLQY